MMGINAVKGVEIGAGFASVAQRGTTHGDSLTPHGFASNNAGGVLTLNGVSIAPAGEAGVTISDMTLTEQSDGSVAIAPGADIGVAMSGDAEGSVKLTHDGLTITAAASYTDAKTKNNLCAIDDPTYQCTADPDNSIAADKGTRLPVTPKFNGNATVRYQFPLGPGEMHLQSVIAHRSSATPDIRVDVADDLGRIKGSTTVDFALGFDWNNYSFELFLQNAFDERAELSRFSNCGQCNDRVQILVNTPQTIGARLGAKF